MKTFKSLQIKLNLKTTNNISLNPFSKESINNYSKVKQN